MLSNIRVEQAAAWLVDPWGRPHGVRSDRTIIGRTSAGDIALFHHTVSREHAAVYRARRTWSLRDLGSKNGTRVGGERIEGRIALVDQMAVQLGKVPLVFRTVLPADAAASTAAVAPSTASVADDRQWRCELGDPNGNRKLLLLRLGAGADHLAGILTLVGADRAEVEASLPAVEFELLRLLALRAQAVAGAQSQIRQCVSTRQLAQKLPFRSANADEENVRQAVRRTRAALRRIDIDGIIEALPPHGYRLTWPVR